MRALGGLVAIVLVIAATVFFAADPGEVEITWEGWQIGTSVGVLVAAVIVAGVVVASVWWLLAVLLGGPRALLRRQRERRRRAGYQALTRGMVAVAAGDPQEARRYARRAEALLAEPPLTLLLSAQSAQLGGDETAAKRFFTLMLDRPETEFLGLRGLFNQALRDGDCDTARRLAERAAALRPDTGWAVASLLDLEARGGRWPAARDALAKAMKAGIIPPATARHHRAVIDHELSRAAAAAGDTDQAILLAARAQETAPDLAAPAAHYARLLHRAGRPARAAKAVERAWRTAPQPELAQVYRLLWDREDPLAQLVRCERLAAQNPRAYESHLALAEAAFSAKLWGETRRHLQRALQVGVATSGGAIADPPAVTAPPVPDHDAEFAGATTRLCLMMAQLEEAEHQDLASASEWIDRAAAAIPDPRYICASCGSDVLEWSALCPRCGAFDALAWRTPPAARPDRLLRNLAADPAISDVAAAPAAAPQVAGGAGR
ncbi:MAG TPA: heme biosynthesis HemY N-terminal domain-containing protein [Stellaceae bacterium]|nr:heme biosynthesis HemY N-terminal domain-containing protein [Stellaceae bacterium]